MVCLCSPPLPQRWSVWLGPQVQPDYAHVRRGSLAELIEVNRAVGVVIPTRQFRKASPPRRPTVSVPARCLNFSRKFGVNDAMDTWFKELVPYSKLGSRRTKRSVSSGVPNTFAAPTAPVIKGHAG